MHTLSSVRLLLCLMIFAAHFHCVMAHGAALVRQVEEARCVEPPIGETKTCENESGCICKGALIPSCFASLQVDCHLTDFQPGAKPQLYCADVALREGDSDDIPAAAAPPLAGADARILLQSFQN